MKSENKFLGTMIWDFFDLITFGAFEKKAKKKKIEANNNSTNSTNSTQPA